MSYPLFDRACTIFCATDRPDRVLACVKATVPTLRITTKRGAITIKDADSVLVLTKTKFVRGGFKGPHGAFNRAVLGAATYFRRVRRPAAIRDRVVTQIAATQLLIGCVATPAFFAHDVVFAIARAMNGLVFDGQGMLDGGGKLVLDSKGRHDIQVFRGVTGRAD